MPARVLVVCTANICRSPAIAHLLAGRLGPDVEIESRGVQALPGAAMCAASSTWSLAQGAVAGQHHAQQLERADVKAATIVLTASRSHREAVLQLRPTAQVRTFTLVQAARLAAWVQAQGITAPDGDVSDRLLWLTEELDASRSLAPRPASEEDDSLPDPHFGADHAAVHQRILDAVQVLTAAVA